MKLFYVLLLGDIVGRRQTVALVALLMFSLSSFGASASAADNQASDFVRSLGERAISVLGKKEGSTFVEREAAFRNILVEGFHIETISRFVLGRHWKTATKYQREAYSDIFVDFIVRVYASRFDSYNGQTFEILKTVKAGTEGDMLVRTRILRPSGGTPVGVDFRVRMIRGGYRVVDINVEGISMLHTHRVEFASVIKRKGMDGLLEELRAQVEARGSAAE
jgi:phospholipid transport system substrate-binding protein